jgi:hypothetical protein
MVIANDPSGRFAYVLKSDLALPEDQRTTFWLRVLTMREREALIAQGSKATDQPAKYLHVVCRVGLDGWDNLKTAAGEVVECELAPRGDGGLSMLPNTRGTYLTDRSIERIPFSVLDELATAIVMQNTIGNDDRKN